MPELSVVTFQRIARKYNAGGDRLPPFALSRWQYDMLLQTFAACGFREGAELGVREGLGSLKLCEAMPGLHLLCVDPWAVWPGHTDMQRHADNPLLFLEEARERLAGYDCEFIRARSADVAGDVPDGSLDFVVLDGDHSFDGTMLDLILWAPKVRRGGVVCGHEYEHKQRGHHDVIPAVNAYTVNHLIREWYVTRLGGRGTDVCYFWLQGGTL